MMPKLILRYPDGAPGLALLLLRLSHALGAFPSLARLWPAPDHWALVAIPAAILALSLTAGIGTRVAALLLACASAAAFPDAPRETACLLLSSAGGSAALALLGPGAYSIEARRFGRQVIRLEPRSPDRGSGG